MGGALGSLLLGTVLLGSLLPTATAQLLPPLEPPREEPCLPLRYNPPACECTPFEVRQGDLWSRIVLLDDSGADLVRALVAEGKRDAGLGKVTTWAIVGAVTSRVERCPLGHPHPRREVRRLCAPVPEEPLPAPAPAPTAAPPTAAPPAVPPTAAPPAAPPTTEPPAAPPTAAPPTAALPAVVLGEP